MLVSINLARSTGKVRYGFGWNMKWQVEAEWLIVEPDPLHP